VQIKKPTIKEDKKKVPQKFTIELEKNTAQDNEHEVE